MATNPILIQNKKSVVIIIPVYKNKLNENEDMSLKQCLRILGIHHIIFFCAHKFDCSYYYSICDLIGIPFEKRTFNSKYFRSKKDYNNLCLTKKFYKKFCDFDYILIYQLDAWVFSDYLDYWCSQNYDFIGAPFPADLNAREEDVLFTVVGNGGFSLRKINSMINLFDHKYYRIKRWTQLIEAYQGKIAVNPLWLLYCLIRLMGYKNTIGHLKKNNWEDHFFYDIARLTSFIRIPDPYTALRFSFEYRPSVAFSQNGNILPMGCHGWHWIEYNEFWRKYIQ
jgi:hypothetical protein